MNTPSIERQLQQLDAPAPDPSARLRARQAALAEFERLHARPEPKPARGWAIPKLWLGGFATACVAIVGVSLFWLLPAQQRVIVPQAATPAIAQAAVEQQPGAAAKMESPPPPVGGSRKQAPVAGRPPAPSSSQGDGVDSKTIPSNLLEHTDVVTGGASATYGSGAMAGNVNLVPPPRVKAEPPPTTLIVETTAQPVPRVPPAPAALAKRADQEELEEVQVTGTRAQTPAVTAANPVSSITGEELRRLGITNVADALTELTPSAALSGLTPAAAPTGGAADRGSSFIGNTIANLRGLDPQFGGRTLTLVDGRRVVSTSSQADVVDPNVKPGQFQHFEVNPVKRTADEPVSTFSADVDTASYSFVRRELNSGVLPPADAVRTEEMINYFDYSWPGTDSRERPFKPTVTVSDSPWGKGRKLVHIGIRGYELPARQRPDVNLVLLLDVSGSMDSPDRLPLAQRSMALLLDSLKPTDTVGIAVYAGRAGEVLPPTPVSEKDAILQALYSLRPGGSTAGAAGIQLAYEMARRNFRKGGVNRILLATDGDFNVGIRDVNELKSFVQRQREDGVFLSVLGFGVGNYRDEMAQVLAQNGNGVAAYIDTLNEARKVLVQEAGSQLFTIARDVKLQVEFNPATVAEYRLVGYETRALNREDFNNDKVDAGDIGTGHTVTAIYEITPVGAEGALVDQRRYGTDDKPAAPRGRSDEYGYLKIRYKLPDSSESQLIEQPIAVKAGVPAAVRRDVQFSTAVAGFAQLLQGGRYTGSLDYNDVYSEAADALGKDPNGYRAEFLQLVRRAQGLARR